MRVAYLISFPSYHVLYLLAALPVTTTTTTYSDNQFIISGMFLYQNVGVNITNQ